MASSYFGGSDSCFQVSKVPLNSHKECKSTLSVESSLELPVRDLFATKGALTLAKDLSPSSGTSRYSESVRGSQLFSYWDP